MKADYDSEANAISIDLVDVERWEYCEATGDRINVAIAGNRPVNIELLYPDLGIDEPLRIAADRYNLDAEALSAAARAALAAPDRPVELGIGVRPAA
jgi:hypothetical protein